MMATTTTTLQAPLIVFIDLSRSYDPYEQIITPIRNSMLLFIISLSLLFTTTNQQSDSGNHGYCLVGKGVFYTEQCYTSGVDDLANCCFQCFDQNASGLFGKCGSLYGIGGTTCAQATFIETAKLLCNGGAFSCQCNLGNNLSQLFLVNNATYSPSSALTTTVTVKTNSANKDITHFSSILQQMLLFTCALFFMV
jgi:hypothetical protein